MLYSCKVVYNLWRLNFSVIQFMYKIELNICIGPTFSFRTI